ncbi:MAG: ESPR-type extended signal peptide-containing protein [Veillonella sp.]|nr:ESPR-type extended signal peptide-containing protein [Veillonella sp.]
MNKIFKVVWSKTKECYVVVSEVAKNNGGKKKALSTVFAALVAAGAMMPGYVDAANNTSGGGVSTADASIAIGSGWGNSAYANNNFSIAIGDQTHANGKAAIALGRQAKTDGEEASIAIGNETEATAKDSTAVGSGSKSSGEYAAALGFQTKATANYATAIGSGARGYAEDSQAIGREAETSAGATRAIAIGTLSKSSGNYATSVGSSAEATAERAIAVGYKSTAKAQSAISVGNLANADHTDSIAVGNGSAATGDQAIATGSNATATKIGSIAMGKNVAASGDYSTAIGNKAKASGANSIAFGSSIDNTTTGTVASGDNSIAIGMKSTASGDGAVAHGVGSQSTGDHSVAVGRLSKAKGAESLALGDEAEATVDKSVAVGYKANATIVNGVALGSESKTTVDAGQVGYNPAAGRTNKYDNLTNNTDNVLTSNRAAIAIGDDDAHITRQLTGLAAGTKDTDAVNVAQLRAVNLKYAGNSGNSDVLLDNGTLNIKGEGLLSTTADGTGITVKLTKGDDIAKDNGKAKEPTNNGVATTQNVVQAINNSYWKATAGGNTDGTPAVGNVKPGTQVTYSAGDNLKVKQTINATTGDQEYKYSLNPVLTGITSIANTTTGPKMTFGGNSINITGGSLDMGTNKITNLAPGTADNDAVNVKQLKDTELHITPGTYTPDANKKVKLTYTDGNNTVVTGKEAVIDLSGLATGGTASTEKVKKAANGANDTNIAEVNPQTGDTYGAAGATYEVSVSRNAVKDAAREAVTVNNGGTTTGGTYTADTNNPISVTAVPDNTNHNTTYAVTFDGNKAAKQIPLTYKATNGTITTADQTVKLDKGLNFTGGDYTTASVGADGKVTFDVNLGTAPTVTDGKPGVPGQAGAAGKDGIATVKTVVDTINNSGWKANAKANGGTLVGNSTATVVKPGDQVNFAAGKNLTVKQDLTGEHTYTYSLNKDVDLTNAGSLTVGDTTVNNGGITIKAPTPAAGTTATTTDVKLTNTGLDNGGNKIVNVAEGTVDTDAVNVKQLKDAKTVLADGKNTKKSGTGTAADPYKVNVEGDLTGISSITNDGTNNGKISFGPNKTVTVDGDHSITLNASTGKIGGLQNLTFDPTNFTSGQAATEDQLKSVHDTLKASELHIAPTESNRTGEHIAGAATSNTAAGAAANAYKYDATTKQVVLEYNDGTGANKTGTKAVIDFSALNTGGTTASTWTAKTSAENTTAGSEVGKHAGDTSQVIGNQNSVDFQAGKNMTVKQTNDTNGNTTINYALNKDLDVESVHVGKDGKDGKIGIDGKDGVDGLDGTNRVDIHVEKGAKGVDGTDGHDGENGHNGKDGMTRIVYEDKGGKQEVATLNDGMKYAGDDAQGTDKTKVIAKKLNETLDIIGGATKADLTTDNIGVNNDGNGKLLVQLSKNLKGINTIKNGNTTITLNDAPSTTTPAVTITGGNLSLGDGTTNNKIVNVAPGTDDTDAVNVKQLKAAKTEVKAGKNVVVTSETSTTDGHTTYTVNASTPAVYTKPDGTKLVKQPDGTFKDENGNAYTGSVIASFEDGTGATTGGNMIVNNIGSAIKGLGSTGDNYLTKLDLANTATPNAAVNVSDLKNTADALKSNELHIRPTTSGRTGETVNQGAAGTAESYKYDATTKSVTLKYNDGTGAGVTGTEAKIDLSDLANQITSGYTFKANATANGGTVANDATTPAVATTVENGGTINYAAGKNLTVKQDINATAKTHTYTYSLNKDLTNLDKVVVNGENGTNGKDGVTIIGPQGATGATGMPGTNGIDGKVGITGKDGKDAVSISGKDGIGTIGLTGPQGPAGADGRGVDITTDHGTQTLNKPEANNGGKSERIVYVPKDKDGNPLKDDAGNTIKREVATMDDGLKFTGNNESTENKHKLGSLVKVKGEGVTEAQANAFTSAAGNIAVVADGTDTLTVKLNKNLAGINKISNGNSSITLNDTPSTTTPAVTISGGNLSMGDGTTNNKIVNVAPGTDDSDAVNYKQLKAAKTEVKAGKNVVVTSDTSAADGHTTYTVNASTPAVYTKPDGTKLVKQPDGTFKDENGNAYTGSVIASFEDGTGATTGGNMIVNNVGSAIKTQTGGDFLTKLDNANTATPNAAVNVSDLKSTADALKANERHIAPTTVATGSTETKGGTANATGTNVYKYDAASKTVTLTYNDGNGNAVTDTKAVIDLSNLSTGGTGASSWNVKSSANTTDGGAVGDNHNANVQNIADTKTVEFQSGKNLVVKQTNDTTNGNATVEFSLADNIVAGKDGANGKDGSVGATGKDGSSVVLNGKDGSIGMTGPKGQDGKDGINGRDGADISITSAKGEQVLVNRDPAHNSDTDKAERIVYVPKDASGNPIQDANGKNIVREVATMDDGLRFTGNNTGTENKRKLGSLVKVQGEDVSAADEAAFQSAGGNIAVTADGTDTLTIRLNKNLKGLNSIQLGDNTIKSNGDNIEFTTKGGDTKTVATTDQLWTIQANGVDVPAKSGKVNLVAGDHITITPDAANGKMTISATGFGSMDGFNVKTSADANGTHAGDTTENIKNGKTVDMQAGKNLVVTQSNDGNGNTTVNYALNKDVDLGTNGSLKTGDTTINNDGFKNGNTTVGGNGMTINNPTDPAKTVSLTKDGLNNGGNQITNVASGGNTDTNGANIGDVKRIAKAGDTRIKDDTYTVDNTGTVELTYVDGAGKQVTDAAGNPLKAKITGITTLDSTRVNVAVNKTGTGEVAGSTAPVKVTKGTEFVAGNNLIVERKAHTGNDLDNSVVYSLNSNLTGINSISNTTTGPKMTFGGNSINVTNGDLNMGGNKITNLAPGKDKTDAATVGQLTKVTSNNHSVVINKTTDADGAPVYDLAVTGTPGAPAADPRVDMLGEEIGRVGAQGAALSALKPIQYDPLEPTQIMAGYGNYRGNSALALGVAHYKNESTLIHGGVSWAGGSSHMMANAGVTWKVGNRDSEAAVADRYRKGPISSAYAMQQEMASVKAQNAGLKSEVSDLKAENEQMKAQIAAMMAKLGM